MLFGILEFSGLVRGPVALRTQCFDFASRFCGADCFALIASEENILWSYGPSRRFEACNAMPITFVYTASAKCVFIKLSGSLRLEAFEWSRIAKDSFEAAGASSNTFVSQDIKGNALHGCLRI